MLGLLAVAGGALAQDGQTQDAIRQQFAAAYEAAVSGRQPPNADAALADYVLFDYLVAARLERALLTATGPAGQHDSAAAEFIAAHDGQPVARRVRAAWLASLARRGLERELIANYSRRDASIAVDCHYLQARIALQDTDGIDAPILDRWLTGRRLPPPCEPVFRWGRANGIIDADAIADRVRRLLDNGQPGFARIIARPLEARQRLPLERRADLIEHPEREFARIVESPAAAPEETTLLDAWDRHTRTRPTAAAPMLAPLAEAIGASPRVHSRLSRALALGLAWDRQPTALTHFEAIAAADFDDDTREWHARAALWAGEWDVAAGAIAAMSRERRHESAWQYWHARVSEALGNDVEAGHSYAAVIERDNFYSALAAARLGRRFRPQAKPLVVDAASVRAIETTVAFERARELYFAGIERDARREWNVGYAALPTELRTASVRVAAGWGWHEMAVLTASRNEVFFDYELLYPREYQEEVDEAAGRAGLSDELLLALIRQESLFSPTAVSSAGAVGLTQLKLETARRAARRHSIERPSRGALLEPRTNITLGAMQLKNLLDDFDGQLLPAIAGYNAGYYAAERWLPEQPLDADIWVENIPFNETRAYVRRVLWHSLVYAYLDSGRPAAAEEWLAPIRAL